MIAYLIASLLIAATAFAVRRERQLFQIGVLFYAVQAAIVHPFRETAEEISGSAGWLQYIPCGKSYIGKYLIHRTDHSRRRIKGV